MMPGMKLRLVFLVLLLLPVAFAQVGFFPAEPLSCSVDVPVIPALSPTSPSALVGDIFADCSHPIEASSAGTPMPQANLLLFLNISALSTTQPLLAIDAAGTPSNPNTLLCPTPATGCTGIVGASPYDGSTGHPNLFDGLTSGNLVTFFGVPLQAPIFGHLTFEFEGISVNPSILGPGAKVTAAFVESSGTLLQFPNPSITVAEVAAPEPASLSLCALALGLAVLRRRAARA